MNRLAKHAPVIEAVAAVLTVVLALAALVGVKLQLDAADLTQQRQSARDAYRAHLALSIERPTLAAPADVCALAAGENGPAYSAFVDHLLYAAEQMLAVTDGWQPTFEQALVPHAPYLCSDLGAYDEPLATLLARFRTQVCTGVTPCP